MSFVEIVGWGTCLATFVQIYFWANFCRIKLTLGKSTHTDLPHILICTHNDSHALRENLPLLLERTTAPVMVIDHGSTDGSSDYLMQLAGEYARLDIHSIERSFGGKKEALVFGLSQVKSTHVLLTDADCHPRQSGWDREMVRALNQDALACIGVSPLKADRGLAALFASHDSFLTAMAYIYKTQRGRPYMAVGRNLLLDVEAARNHISFKVGDFVGGDDDVTINRLRNHGSISAAAHPSALTYSTAPSGFKDLLNKRRRHIGTASEYRHADRLYLALIALSHWWHYAGVVLLVVCGLWPWGLVFWLLRLSVVYLAYFKIAVPWGGRGLVMYIPIVDLFYILFYPAIALFLLMKKKPEW